MRTIALVTVLSAAACAAPARQVTATPAPATTTTAKRWIPAVIVPATTTTVYVSPIPRTLRAIGGCESSGSPNGPLVWTARNPRSTASGAFQELDSTWRAWEARWGAERVSRALYADEQEQVRVALAAYNAEGTAPWSASSGCWRAAA